MANLNITERLKQGRKIDRDNHRNQEAGKLGTLRAGNSGIMSETGDIAGTCHRKGHLRSIGVQGFDEPDDHKLIMFQLGYANEDVLYKDLIKTSEPDEILLREEEIPIAWYTKNGTKVTGRPDVVICKRVDKIMIPEGTTVGTTSNAVDQIILYTGSPNILDASIVPILGLELKSVHSVWVARDLLFSRQPKLSNLIQAAHYMWQLKIPYRLIYKGYSSLGQGMSWSDRMANMFPAVGTPGSEWMEYNEKTGKPKQVKQFEIVFELELDSKGRVMYRLEGSEKWERSLATVGDLERYYEYVSGMAETGDLGPRPMTLDAQGGKLNYTDCQYCPLQEVCDKNEEGGYKKWLTAVKKLVPVTEK